MEIMTSILNKVPYQDLQLISHLIYHDGPYLSHFEDTHGNSVLFHWCDVTDTHNRWLVFAVTEDQMVSFLQKEISQRELLLNAIDNITYMVDINDRGEHETVVPIPSDTISEKYLSSPDSYFDESLSPYIGDGYACLLANVRQLRQENISLRDCAPSYRVPDWPDLEMPETDESKQHRYYGNQLIDFFTQFKSGEEAPLGVDMVPWYSDLNPSNRNATSSNKLLSIEMHH